MSQRNIARFVEVLKLTRYRPMRREDLQDELGCSRNTVEKDLHELLAHGVIVKTAVVSPRTGRPLVAFRLAPEWGGEGG